MWGSEGIESCGTSAENARRLRRSPLSSQLRRPKSRSSQAHTTCAVGKLGDWLETLEDCGLIPNLNFHCHRFFQYPQTRDRRHSSEIELCGLLVVRGPVEKRVSCRIVFHARGPRALRMDSLARSTAASSAFLMVPETRMTWMTHCSSTGLGNLVANVKAAQTMR